MRYYVELDSRLGKKLKIVDECTGPARQQFIDFANSRVNEILEGTMGVAFFSVSIGPLGC